MMRSQHWINSLSPQDMRRLCSEELEIGALYPQAHPDALWSGVRHLLMGIILKDKSVPKRIIRADANGCYEFERVDSGELFRIIIRGSDAPEYVCHDDEAERPVKAGKKPNRKMSRYSS